MLVCLQVKCCFHSSLWTASVMTTWLMSKNLYWSLFFVSAHTNSIISKPHRLLFPIREILIFYSTFCQMEFLLLIFFHIQSKLVSNGSCDIRSPKHFFKLLFIHLFSLCSPLLTIEVFPKLWLLHAHAIFMMAQNALFGKKNTQALGPSQINDWGII